MKTTPKVLRDLADYTGKRDDPDTTTALRWAADDIERLTEALKFIEELTREVQPEIAMIAPGELLCRHILRKITEAKL